jgi:hypothetical protein
MAWVVVQCRVPLLPVKYKKLKKPAQNFGSPFFPSNKKIKET